MKNNGNDEPRDIEPFVKIFLQSVLASLLESGVPRDRLASDIHVLIKRLETGEPICPIQSDDLSFYRTLSNIVHEWCHDPWCTSPITGQPLPLRLDTGTVTLPDLIERHLPRLSVPRAIAWMETNEIILAQDDGAYALKRPTNLVLADRSVSLVMHRLSNLVSQQVSTTLTNFRVSNATSRNLERAANVSHLPVKFLDEFRMLTKTQGQNFLEIINNWLTDRNAPHSTEPTTAAGVHIYGYTSPTTPPKPPRHRKH